MDKPLHWTNHWETISARIASPPKFLLASDFDGTLAPIARTPIEVVMPTETRTLLRRLAACSGVHLAIISGRALADVQLRVGLPGIFYAGNHGLELCGPGIELHDPRIAKVHSELASAVAFIVEATSSMEGVFVEDKGASAAVHWRLAPEKSRIRLHDLMQVVADANPRLRLGAGKCVWELRPKQGWNKGNVLMHLTTRLGLDPEEVLFLGDDLTDEDAFRVMPGGLSFHVGETGEHTAALYSLRDDADVRAFLLCVLGIRTGEPSPFVATSPLPLSPDEHPVPRVAIS